MLKYRLYIRERINMINATEIDNSQKIMLKMKNLGIEHLNCTENIKVLSLLLKYSFNKI